MPFVASRFALLILLGLATCLPGPALALTPENRALLRLLDEICVARNGSVDAAAGRALAMPGNPVEIRLQSGPPYRRAVSFPGLSLALVLVSAPNRADTFNECRVTGRSDDIAELEAAACAKWPLGPLRNAAAGTRAFAVTTTAGRRMLSLRLTTARAAGLRAGTFTFEAALAR